MEPDAALNLIQKALGLVKQLGEMGVAVNLPVMLLVLVTMEAVKSIDKAAWVKWRKKPRGVRPGDSGYLVAVYPLIAVVLGGSLAMGWWALMGGGTLGASIASGCVSGALMALAYKGYTTWRNFRQLAAKIRAGAGG